MSPYCNIIYPYIEKYIAAPVTCMKLLFELELHELTFVKHGHVSNKSAKFASFTEKCLHSSLTFPTIAFSCEAFPSVFEMGEALCSGCETNNQ